MYKTSVYTLVNGDVINRAKFYLNQIRGYDSVGVEFLAFP